MTDNTEVRTPLTPKDIRDKCEKDVADNMVKLERMIDSAATNIAQELALYLNPMKFAIDIQNQELAILRELVANIQNKTLEQEVLTDIMHRYQQFSAKMEQIKSNLLAQQQKKGH